MKSFLALILLGFSFSSVLGAEFAVFDVYLDTRGKPLAAYQLKVSDQNAAIKILSVEGGEHTSFSNAPAFDPKAIQRNVIKMAAFSLDAPGRLPTGRVRVASLHVEIGPGLTPNLKAALEAAAQPGGKKISAEVSISKRENQ